MNRDHVGGALKQAEGALRQAAVKLKTAGGIDRPMGTAQNAPQAAMGGAKDALRDTNNRTY